LEIGLGERARGHGLGQGSKAAYPRVEGVRRLVGQHTGRMGDDSSEPYEEGDWGT